MTAPDIVARLRAERLVPVLVIEDAAQAVPLVHALAAGGLRSAEVTFRTAAAGEALRRIAAEVPEVLLGAGTVLTPELAAAARDAGAKFVVAPGLNPRVVRYCLDEGIPVIPGVCTASEIERALELGLRIVKFFPAEPAGGVAYLRAVAAPFGELEFMPTGGITAANVGSYLQFERVVACGGSWMAKSDWIAAGRFQDIQDEAARAALAARVPQGER